MTDHTDLIPLGVAADLIGIDYRSMKWNVDKPKSPAPHETIGTHKFVIRSKLASWNLERLGRKRGRP